VEGGSHGSREPPGARGGEGMLILSLCDRTGNWSRPYEEAGYIVDRVDLADGRDVRLMEYPAGRVHGILAAPPCTMFANSGARWQRTEQEIMEALSIVDACLRLVAVCQPDWWVLENPVGKLRRYLGAPTYTFDPCDYGDPYTKRTLLWGRFTIPTIQPVYPAEGSKMHRLPANADRANIRSATPPGFARAFFEANP